MHFLTKDSFKTFLMQMVRLIKIKFTVLGNIKWSLLMIPETVISIENIMHNSHILIQYFNSSYF